MACQLLPEGGRDKLEAEEGKKEGEEVSRMVTVKSFVYADCTPLPG